MPSDLQVSNIRDLTNANSAISIASDGQVTIAQNNPTVTLGSNATFPSGIIKTATVFTNSTRTTVSNSTSTDREIIDLGDYNKLSSSTKLLISVFCPIHGPHHSGVRGIGIKYGSASTEWCGAYYYVGTSSPYTGFVEAHCYLPSHSTTGSQAISLREGSSSGNDGRPFLTINPTSTDETRYHSTRSTIRVYEII